MQKPQPVSKCGEKIAKARGPAPSGHGAPSSTGWVDLPRGLSEALLYVNPNGGNQEGAGLCITRQMTESVSLGASQEGR